jgi:hypothetical protein
MFHKLASLFLNIRDRVCYLKIRKFVKHFFDSHFAVKHAGIARLMTLGWAVLFLYN